MGGLIGARIPRVEDGALLLGQGRFVDDIGVAGVWHAAVVRSPHPHAAVRWIDAQAARVLPGVHAVLTLDDLAPVLANRRMLRHSNSGTPLDRYWSFALADAEVSYVGEAVAMVLAENRYLAEDAAAMVAVDYDVLASVADARAAIERAAPAVRRELNSNIAAAYKIAYGDVEAAFAGAAHVFHEELWQHRGGAHPIEGRGILAEWRDDAMVVWASTQKAHDLFQSLTALLDFDESRLRVATPDVGGGFGPKLCVYPEDIAVVAAAKLLQRSIKWIEDRREHFTNAAQERDQYWSLDLAVAADAKLLGVRGRLIHDLGAYALQDVNIPYNSASMLSGRYIGIGLAHGIKGTGRGPFESGVVRVSNTGRLSVFTGAAAIGQGLGTALAQICAGELGLRAEDITVVPGDTGGVSLGLGAFASRQTVTAGSSVLLAARAVADKAKKLASHVLEAAEHDLELVDGEVRVVGASQLSIKLGELARILKGAPGYGFPADIEPGLDANVNWRTDALAYANACHVAEVEVDPDTGGVKLLNYVAMQDSGTLINPMIVDGQVRGGVAHGIGNAILEWMGFDESGQPVTTTFADYLLPTAMDVPAIATLYKETPSPLNPLGAKGAGEVSTIPTAAAVISAIEDALQPFGVCIAQTPVTPAKLVELIAKGVKS